MKMTGYKMIWIHLAPLRLDLPALGPHVAAASVKVAAGRRIKRAWHIPRQYYALTADLRVGDRDSRKQRPAQPVATS